MNASLLYAQASVQGILKDQAEGAPLEYATVALYRTDSVLVGGAVTDESGAFALSGLKPGDYYLLAQFVGFRSLTVPTISVAKNEEVSLGVLSLSPDDQLLAEVGVTGEKVTSIHKIDRQVYEAEKFRAAQGGTATDVLRGMPSVSMDVQGNISVRGSSGFVVLLNGKPLQSDPALVLGQLPANAIERVELITAPSAKYDPEGKAGLINIITKKGAADGAFLQANVKYGLPSIQDYDNAEAALRHGADVTAHLRKGKWQSSVGLSYLRNDISGRREGDVYTVSGDTITQFPSDGERSFDDQSYSGRLTLTYSPTASDEFSLGVYGGKRSKDRTADILYDDNHARLQFTGERLYTFQYFNENLRIRKGDFALGSIDYAHTFGDGAKLSASVLYEYTLLGGPTTNVNLNPQTGEVYQEEYNTNDNPLDGFRAQIDYSLPMTDGLQWDMGYQYRSLVHTGDFVYQRKNNATGAFELVPEFSSEVDLSRRIHSGYVQLSGSQGKWEYGAGLRLEVMDRELSLKDKAGQIDTLYQYDFVQPYPSANVQYAVSESLRLKAAYSRRVERTTTFKMNPFPEREHSETLEQGDPTLKPEFIDLIELGAVKDFGANSVFATAYYRNVDNLVNRVNTVFNDTILNRIYSNVGVGTTFGLELGAELQPTSWWKVFAGGNVYHYGIDGRFDERPVSSSAWIHSINANMTFDIRDDLSVQWALNYLSDRVTAQGEDSRYLSPNLTIRKDFGERFSATLQWLNMDMGLLPTNEQRITTWREGSFYTTTNYVYEVDMIMINLTYAINKSLNKSRFIKSEFGEKEF
ncbi:TonB-dependent receptor domain-containing protein [Marinoscillum furvescens]|nr:TonB-dependent receptor [Marinoscillum furvescens]